MIGWHLAIWHKELLSLPRSIFLYLLCIVYTHSTSKVDLKDTYTTWNLKVLLLLCRWKVRFLIILSSQRCCPNRHCLLYPWTTCSLASKLHFPAFHVTSPPVLVSLLPHPPQMTPWILIRFRAPSWTHFLYTLYSTRAISICSGGFSHHLFCRWTQCLYCHISLFATIWTHVTVFKITPLGYLTETSNSICPNRMCNHLKPALLQHSLSQERAAFSTQLIKPEINDSSLTHHSSFTA